MATATTTFFLTEATEVCFLTEATAVCFLTEATADTLHKVIVTMLKSMIHDKVEIFISEFSKIINFIYEIRTKVCNLYQKILKVHLNLFRV